MIPVILNKRLKHIIAHSGAMPGLKKPGTISF
jgi:hypothetical protein